MKTEFFAEVNKNITSWYSYFSHNYDQGVQDKRFSLLNQWTQQERNEMRLNGIPELQTNLLYSTTKAVIGQFSELEPNLQLRPKDFVLTDETDDELIKLQNKINFMTDLLRSIAYDSKSNTAYKEAFANIIYQGYGALRVTHDYVDCDSFNTKAGVESIPDPERAFFDANAKSPTKTDGNFCGLYTILDKNTFEEMYPDVPFPASYPSQYPAYFYWIKKDTISVVDYYVKEYYKKTLLLLDNGETIEEKDLEEYLLNAEENGLPIPLVEKKRKADDYKIMHYRMIRDTILDKSEFPSKVLPVIFVPGDSFIFEGREYMQSFVRHAIDSQRVVNYALVSLVHSLKNIRKEQYMISTSQLRGNEEQWTYPDRVQGVLSYTETNAPPPIKLPAGEASQSLYTLFQQASRDIQATMGVFDANLGAPTSEVSGVAIDKKQRYGNLSQVVYRDSIFTAMEEVGRCIMSMIPRVYDSKRPLNLQNQDGSVQQIMLNKDDDTKIAKDKYDVIVEAGLSFDDQKTETLNLLLKLVSMSPQAMPLVADLFADLLDVENRAQLVERFRTLVPPEILAKEAGQQPTPQQPSPAQIQAQQQQMQMQMQMQQKQEENAIENRKLDIEEQQLALNAEKLKVESASEQNKSAANQVALMKILSEEGIAQGDNKARTAQTFAEMYKTNAELKSAHFDTLTKLLDK